jgi:uncharacterized metal-binding protein
MGRTVKASCAKCGIAREEKACMAPGGKAGKGCPTTAKKGLLEKALVEYKGEDLRNFARQASIQEADCYADRDKQPYVMHPVKPRMLEIVEFAKRMNYSKLGLVFCAGLANEALIVGEILENHGFEVVSVLCKAGAVPREEIGLTEEQKIFRGGHESMCNPVFQAMIVNEAGTDFNILLGLCVGHDSMYFKYAHAPTTVLAVKDRVSGHNPLACIYTSGNYGAWVMNP